MWLLDHVILFFLLTDHIGSPLGASRYLYKLRFYGPTVGLTLESVVGRLIVYTGLSCLSNERLQELNPGSFPGGELRYQISQHHVN